MKAGITFALMSLVIAGLNDVVFKRYSLKDRSRGMYIFGIGVIWTLLQAGHTVMSDTPLQWSPATIAFGLAAGILLTLSNILLLESFTHIAVSFGSTIYRLNTIGVVLLSTSILGENLPLFKIVGILLGLAAVSLLYHRDTGHTHDRTFILFAGLAVIASLLQPAMVWSRKRASRSMRMGERCCCSLLSAGLSAAPVMPSCRKSESASP
jgi:drug/metabolite transporter (DMT)-like permease